MLMYLSRLVSRGKLSFIATYNVKIVVRVPLIVCVDHFA
jgi:hypothetical protein